MTRLWGKPSQDRWRGIREKGRSAYLKTGGFQGLFIGAIGVVMHFSELAPHAGLAPVPGWTLSAVMILFYLAIGYGLGYLGWAVIWHFSEKAFLRYDAQGAPSSAAAPGLAAGPVEGLPPLVIEALRRNDKIDAIKEYRAATGTGLKEAKDFIEGLAAAGGKN